MTVASRTKTDSEIQQDVLRELKWDSRVEETDVGVEVDDHVVTLTGTVPTYEKKMAAEEAAHRVLGVLDVANDIEVLFPGVRITDTDLAQRVREALEWQLLIDDEAIKSTVNKGWVTLKGTLSKLSDSYEAARAVRRIKGVKGVTNEIKIKPRFSPSPSQIKEEIEGALDRQAIREANHIIVHSDDGRVRIEGTVRSWPERRAVINAAKYTPGVRDVDDSKLRVDPYITV